MSLFDDDKESVVLAIEYFNALSDEDKALVVSDLNPQTFKLWRRA